MKSQYQIDDQGRQCRVCKDYKIWDNFYNSKASTTGHTSMCKQCDDEGVNTKRKENPERYKMNIAQWKAQNPEKWQYAMKKMKLKKYDLTPEQYDVLLRHQGNKCAICGRIDSGRKRDNSFLVDHDHKTGRVRGLLCYRCNTGIGYLGDDVVSVGRVLDYLN